MFPLWNREKKWGGSTACFQGGAVVKPHPHSTILSVGFSMVYPMPSCNTDTSSGVPCPQVFCQAGAGRLAAALWHWGGSFSVLSPPHQLYLWQASQCFISPYKTQKWVVLMVGTLCNNISPLGDLLANKHPAIKLQLYLPWVTSLLSFMQLSV